MLKQIRPSPFLVSWHLSKLGQHPCICSLLFWSVGSHIHMSALNMVIESQCIATKFRTIWWNYTGSTLWVTYTIDYTVHINRLTWALRHTPTPLSIRLAGSTVWSLQCVAYITGVGHYRVVGCTGETVLTICGSTRITTVSGWGRDHAF